MKTRTSRKIDMNTKTAGKKNSTPKGDGTTAKRTGRPKGAVNKGGPLVKRLADKSQNSTLSFLERMGQRAERWAGAETDEKKKETLTSLAKAATSIWQAFNDGIARPLAELSADGYVPPKAATAPIDYSPGRQVWIKSAYRSKYVEMGFEAELDKLTVAKTVSGMVVVRAGNIKFPVPKLHIAVRHPSEEQAA